MKKLFSILIAGIVISFSLSSCGGKTTDEDNINENPILKAKAAMQDYRKNAKIARRQMKDLERQEVITQDYLDTAETLSFKDDESRQKKNDEPVKKDTCCPPVVVVVVPDYYPAPAPKRGTGVKTPKKPYCPTYPGPKKECKTCNPCPTPRTIFIDGEQYTEYTGWDPVKKRLRPQDEQPVDANGQPKTGFLFKDSVWWQKN